MSCAPHVPLPDVPAEAADAEDEGGDVPGRLEDLPVRTGAAAGAGRASGAAVKIGACFLMSRDERIFFTEGDGVVGYQEIPRQESSSGSQATAAG